MVDCPICSQPVSNLYINAHIDSGCESHLEKKEPSDSSSADQSGKALKSPTNGVSSFFQKPVASRASTTVKPVESSATTPKTAEQPGTATDGASKASTTKSGPPSGLKRSPENEALPTASKRTKANPYESSAPLAERMRPKSLDEVCGQELVGENGVLRGLIETDRVPSMVLWGGPGTGKTTIARLIARTAGRRFVEINSTTSGVGECKRLFEEARNEQALTARKTIIFCDEIHRFSKSQQDVFLGPVEAGQITLIGATTENPSFKVINPLLSRCRVFTLSKLTEPDITTILQRAISSATTQENPPSSLLDDSFLNYLATFADGDARTALNLLELALDLSSRQNITQDQLKQSLTHTLVYDRAGDQHYDSISALHKSLRGSDADASLYYLARMLQSGEDALYIARRLIVVASEDVGLADPTMLPLAAATYTACEKVGLPEARINLAHCVVALALAPKSTRAYRGLEAAMRAVAQEPGVAGLPVPYHLRNAPTKLMKEIGYGKQYKYNPEFKGGKVKQEYLPEKLIGRKFLGEADLGDEVDADLKTEEADGGEREKA